MVTAGSQLQRLPIFLLMPRIKHESSSEVDFSIGKGGEDKNFLINEDEESFNDFSGHLLKEVSSHTSMYFIYFSI